MAKFRKKPVVIEATQWFKNGDHPNDNSFRSADQKLEEQAHMVEGSVVRYYRTPKMDGQIPCKHCGAIMHEHGWIDTLEGGNNGAQVVCPKDWIITGVHGEYYPCKPDIFKKTYEPVE